MWPSRIQITYPPDNLGELLKLVVIESLDKKSETLGSGTHMVGPSNLGILSECYKIVVRVMQESSFSKK